MSEHLSLSAERPSLSAKRYRLLDVVSKLVGLALLSLSFETGIVSIAGAALAIAGIAAGVCTVFITEDTT